MPATADYLDVLRDEDFRKKYAAMPIETRIAFEWRLRWLHQAHAHQILPPGDWWSIWLMLAGRGAGKTRTAAEQIGWWAWSQPGTRWLVAAPTHSDVRDTCFLGDSGLISVMPPQLIKKHLKDDNELQLINGSIIKGIAAQEPERFRGPQFHGAWCCIPGTLIRMSEGCKPIEDVVVGDIVETRHGYRRVSAAGVSGNPRDLVRIVFGDTSLTVTEDHPVLVGGRWIPAGDIRAGDLLWADTSTSAGVTAARPATTVPRSAPIELRPMVVSSVARLPSSLTYNLSVEGEHEFIANGVVVHNCDELAAWVYLRDAWDMIQFGVRLGEHTKIIATTTPKPKDLLVELIEREGNDVVITRASTYANLEHLSSNFKKQVLQYEGTSLGRQEIYAEMLDPEEGGIVRRSWFKLWSADKPFPRFEYVVQSYDCATSDKTINDPTACVVLGVFRPGPDLPMGVMLIDCWDEHMKYPDLRPKVVEEYGTVYGDENEFGVGRKTDLVLVEDKSAGISLIQDLDRAGLPVRSYNPGRADKTQRLNIVSPLIARGRVWLPESEVKPGHPRSWVDPMLNQVCSFPDARHDDYVDALTQALRVLHDMGFISIDPVADDDLEYGEDRPRLVNPYAA